MRLRPLLFVIVLSLALLGAAPSAPAQLPQLPGEKQGVTIARGSHGHVIRFAKPSAKVYRRLAGRRVTIRCSTVVNESGNFVVGASVVSVMRAPRKGHRLRTRTARGTDFCSVRMRSGEWVAVAPVTADGRTYLDELFTAEQLDFPFILTADGTDGPPPTALVLQRGRGFIVALDGPDASPPAGKLGYWTDGVRSVSAILTAVGRRLFIDTERDLVRTNVLPYLIEEPE